MEDNDNWICLFQRNWMLNIDYRVWWSWWNIKDYDKDLKILHNSKALNLRCHWTLDTMYMALAQSVCEFCLCDKKDIIRNAQLWRRSMGSHWLARIVVASWLVIPFYSFSSKIGLWIYNISQCLFLSCIGTLMFPLVT